MSETILRILITNIRLDCRTGTETAVRDLAPALASAGHFPMVFSPRCGEIADEIRAAGVPVVSDLRDLPYTPDIIHGHHHAETVRALVHFPAARGIFVCHDRLAWHDFPPKFPRILRYVAVDYNCRERLLHSGGIPEGLIRVIYNSVDTDRFALRPPLPGSFLQRAFFSRRLPRRALVFSNYAGPNTHLEPIQEACRRLCLELDVVGSGTGSGHSHPEEILGNYDLVFAKARCAIEAMASGAAVILCDTRGLGPLVTLGEIEGLRALNFGMRCLIMPLEASRIAGQVGRYDREDASAVTAYIREKASLSAAVGQYLDLYREVLAETTGPEVPLEDELQYYHGATARKLGELDAIISEPGWPYRMDALEEVGMARVVLGVTDAPASVEEGEAFTVRVQTENLSSFHLASLPPHPVNISYHWLSASDDTVILYDGLRTALRPPLLSGEKRIYTASVVAPSLSSCGPTGETPPGNDADRSGERPAPSSVCRLRVTLVQEFVGWLDVSEPALYADVTMKVEGRTDKNFFPGEHLCHDAR